MDAANRAGPQTLGSFDGCQAVVKIRHACNKGGWAEGRRRAILRVEFLRSFAHLTIPSPRLFFFYTRSYAPIFNFAERRLSQHFIIASLTFREGLTQWDLSPLHNDRSCGQQYASIAEEESRQDPPRRKRASAMLEGKKKAGRSSFSPR